VKALLNTCFSGLKSSRWVGDFQVATGGGFWVATRVKSKDLTPFPPGAAQRTKSPGA